MPMTTDIQNGSENHRVVSDDVKELTSYFRKLLSGTKPPIQQVIDCGVVPCLIRFLQIDDNAALQVEAVGAIANIAFTDRSDHIRYLIDAGVVPVLIRLLSSGSDDVRTEVVKALDYIAGFNAEYRDMVLAAGVLPALLQAAEGLTDQLRVAIIRNIVQVICNLCRQLPTPPLSAVEPALPFLTRSLFSQDIKIVEQVCNIFEVLCAGGDNYIQAILQLGVTPRLVELVQNESIKLLLLLNTITGATDAAQLQFLLNHKVLDHPDKDIMISAGDQLQGMIDGGIFPKLFEVLKEERGSIKKQGVCIVYNSILYGNSNQMKYLMDEGVIRLLCSLLQENFLEVVVVRMAVGGLEKILQRNKYDYDLLEGVVKILCDESDGIQALERLKRNKDKRISKGAKSIVEAMFGKHLISEDSLNHLRSIQYYRQMLSINRNPPIQQVIDCGVVPCLIRFLQIDDNAALQVEAVGAISNIADTAISDHIGYLIDVGVVPVLIRLLTSGSDDVRAYVATALGHLGRGYNVEYRDRVLAAGALPALLQAAEDCKETLKQDVLAQISCALSCLSSGDPMPDIRPALPLLARLLSFQDEEIVYCVCLTLVNIALGPETYIDAILQEDLNIISRLMELFVGSTSTKILVPSLKALGNIAFGNERQTQSVLVALPSLLWLLDHPDKQIRVEVCFTLSNITGGTQDQIQAVIDAAIFPKVFEVLKSLDLEVQKEAVFVIANAIERGTIEQVWYLINEGVIPVLCNLLQDNRVNGKEILSSLWGILDAGKKRGRLEDVIRMVSDCDGQNKIEKLKKHKDLDTLILAGRIMNTFFH